MTLSTLLPPDSVELGEGVAEAWIREVSRIDAQLPRGVVPEAEQVVVCHDGSLLIVATTPIETFFLRVEADRWWFASGDLS